MKRYIAVGVLMFIGAIILTVLVWVTIQNALKQDAETSDTNEIEVPITLPVVSEPESQPEIIETPDAMTVEPTAVNSTLQNEESIFLRDLGLSDAQLQAAESFGIDVATFEITPTMIACAELQVGTERLAEFKAGATPGFAEGLSLLGCLE